MSQEDRIVARVSQSSDLKSNNTALVLRSLFAYPHVSRQELVRLTRLAPSTVSKITSELIERGLVRRAGNIGRNGAGRPADILMRNASACCAAAVHVTPDRSRIGIVDFGYTVLETREITFAAGFTEADTGGVVAAVRDVAARYRAPSNLAAIVLALPNYPYNVASIHAQFQQAFEGTPVFHINNTEAMAIHDFYLRLGRQLHTTAYVYVGTGIGSGFIINGSLYRGVNGNACDLGHMYMTDRPLACRCGRVGCLETVASEGAVARALAGHFGLDRPPVRDELVEFVAQRLSQRDAFCEGLVQEAAEYLGSGLFNLVSITDPQRVVVAGRLTSLGLAYTSLVEGSYTKRARRMSSIVPLEFVPVHDDSALVGGAMFSFLSLCCGGVQSAAVTADG